MTRFRIDSFFTAVMQAKRNMFLSDTVNLQTPCFRVQGQRNLCYDLGLHDFKDPPQEGRPAWALDIADGNFVTHIRGHGQNDILGSGALYNVVNDVASELSATIMPSQHDNSDLNNAGSTVNSVDKYAGAKVQHTSEENRYAVGELGGDEWIDRDGVVRNNP